MLKETVISRDIVTANGHMLVHVVAGATYSAAPTLPTQGFFLKGAAGRSYDAYECTFDFDATSDATTKAVVRPWFFVPEHNVGGTWLAGKYMENISIGTAGTDVSAPSRRLNSVPVAATKCYMQVVSIAGTAPAELRMTVFGIEGNVAAEVGDIEATIDADDISVFSVFAQATHNSPVDFTVANTSNVSVTCAGSPFVISDTTCHVVYLLYKPVATGKWSTPLVNGIGGVSITSLANVITVSGAGTPFLAGDTYWVGVQQKVTAAGGGGGAAGGGDSIFTSPQDFSVSYLAATQLTLTGLSYIPRIEQFVSVESVDAAGVAKTYTPDSNAFSYNSITGVLTVASATFAPGDLGYRIFTFGPDKSYQSVTNSKRVQEISPLSGQTLWEELVNTAVLGVGTVYFPSAAGLSLVGYKSMVSQLNAGINAVITIEASVDTSAVPDWLDVTRACYDMTSNATGVANWNNAWAIVDMEDCIVPKVRFKVVVSTAPTPVQIHIRRVAL
jgi:hypothetical protein